jgi:hypothetical protein
MVMAEETFLAFILFSMPVIWMLLKMCVTHLDQQPQEDTPLPFWRLFTRPRQSYL